MIKKFLKSDAGATAIEYGLIAAGVSVAIAVIVFALGSTIAAKFSDVNTKMGG